MRSLLGPTHRLDELQANDDRIEEHRTGGHKNTLRTDRSKTSQQTSDNQTQVRVVITSDPGCMRGRGDYLACGMASRGARCWPNGSRTGLQETGLGSSKLRSNARRSASHNMEPSSDTEKPEECVIAPVLCMVQE